MEVSYHLLIDIASPVHLDGNAKEPDYMSICYSDELGWSGTMFSLQSYRAEKVVDAKETACSKTK